MAGFRDTLNLPQTDFPMKADLPRREPERLRWWQERNAYRTLRERRAGRPLWLLHDGPPYSNGHIHMGTAANYVWKDAAVRAATILGFDASFLPGWDNHGMPIEVQVGKEFRAHGETPDRLTLRRRCREYAAEWVGKQSEDFQRLGVWGEWEHPYLTMDHGFEAAIVETFAGLAARGFVQRGLRSIHWCPTDRTALAEAEIEYADIPSPSVFVLFPLRQDTNGALKAHPDVHAIAWTTTPWTLPANRGLMVDPAATYVVAAADDREFLLAEARLEAVAAIAGWKQPRVLGRLRGAELLGTLFTAPWGNDSRVVDGTPYVSLEDGTGLVHTAPGHGKEDFVVGQRGGLEVACPVDEAGRFTAEVEPFVGRSVLDVNDDVIAWLRGRGRVLAASSFSHAYPHCWRCRRPVIFRATKQWFMMVDHDGHRDRCLDLIDRAVRWDPPASQNRIRESVRGRPDWCLSRQRAWGVGIPALYCEQCHEAFLDAGVMERATALTREHGSDAWYDLPADRFAPEGLRCPHCQSSGPFRKESDILDVWFDSGSTHRAVQATHPGFRELYTRARREGAPIVYFEGPDQHRGWFNSSLMVGAALTREAPYTDVFTHGWVLDGQGRAMHKSLGNVVSPLDIIAKYGADIVRWWALSTDWRNDVRCGDEILQRVADAYRKIRNTFRFLLGNLADFDPQRDLVPEAGLSGVDRAFGGYFDARLALIREAYERREFHRAMDVLLDLCTVHLSAVYLDVSKDRLYATAADAPERRSAQTVLWRALHDLTIAVSPALAFTAEETWQHHPALVREAESVHFGLLRDTRGPGADESAWSALIELRNAVNAAIEPMRAAKQAATTMEVDVEIAARGAAAALLERHRAELEGFLMVARVTLGPAGEAPAEGAASPYAVKATRTGNTKCDRCWTYRADVGEGGICGRCATVVAARGGVTG
jgi:isoleucyl-tRNA synthetase